MDDQGIPSNSGEESQPMDVDSSTGAAEDTQATEATPPASDAAAASGNDDTTDINSAEDSAGDAEKPSATDEAGATEVKSEENNEGGDDAPEETPVKKEDQENASEDAAPAEEPPSEDEPAGTTDDAKSEEAVKASESQDDGKDDPPEQVKEEDTASMDVDSSDANEPEPAKTQAEPPAATAAYSTRGRSTEVAAVFEDKPDRLHISDSFAESPRPKDAANMVSFLVEAMTEEERRTRTRFLPDVDGMTMLRKSEIKDDLALANALPSTVTPSGLETRMKRLGGVSGRKSDSMDVDGDDVNIAFHDETATTFQLPCNTLTTPSDAFVAPKGVVVGDTENSIEVKEYEPAAQSPSKVESCTSFNPPRPPESVGGKKKHRMIRWERRPEDIEVDMKNYRRTVQRTRQELHKSESQYERLEMIDSHLRRNFLNHLDLLEREHGNLEDELDIEAEKLMKESDLVGSRTRSRNLTKVDIVMRDVLTMLTKNEQKDAVMDGAKPEEVPVSSCDTIPGIGGLNSEAFIDWERSTAIESMSPCVSWLEPGQKVTTPKGEGTVVELLPPESPPSNESLAAKEEKESEENKDKDKEKTKMSEEMLRKTQEKKKYDALLPLRVKVQLESGIEEFSATSITNMESTAHFTDAQLAKRWKGMIDSALKVGPCLDLQGMVSDSEKKSSGNGEKESDASESGNADDEFLRFGSTLIPTKFGRGNFLPDMEIPDIEDTLEDVLYDGHGVLGRVSRSKFPDIVHKSCIF